MAAETDEEYFDDPIILFDIEPLKHQTQTECQSSIDKVFFHHSKKHTEENPLIEDSNENEDLKCDSEKYIEECKTRLTKVELVDCGKYSWYFKKYTERIMSLTSEYVHDSNSEYDDDEEDCFIVVDSPNEETQIPKSLETPVKKRHKITLGNTEDVIKRALSMKRTTQIDLKRNVGLIGLTIKPKWFLDTINQPQQTNEANNNELKSNEMVMVKKILNKVGTKLIPISQNSQNDSQANKNIEISQICITQEASNKSDVDVTVKVPENTTVLDMKNKEKHESITTLEQPQDLCKATEIHTQNNKIHSKNVTISEIFRYNNTTVELVENKAKETLAEKNVLVNEENKLEDHKKPANITITLNDSVQNGPVIQAKIKPPKQKKINNKFSINSFVLKNNDKPNSKKRKKSTTENICAKSPILHCSTLPNTSKLWKKRKNEYSGKKQLETELMNDVSKDTATSNNGIPNINNNNINENENLYNHNKPKCPEKDSTSSQKSLQPDIKNKPSTGNNDSKNCIHSYNANTTQIVSDSTKISNFSNQKILKTHSIESKGNLFEGTNKIPSSIGLICCTQGPVIRKDLSEKFINGRPNDESLLKFSRDKMDLVKNNRTKHGPNILNESIKQKRFIPAPPRTGNHNHFPENVTHPLFASYHKHLRTPGSPKCKIRPVSRWPNGVASQRLENVIQNIHSCQFNYLAPVKSLNTVPNTAGVKPNNSMHGGEQNIPVYIHNNYMLPGRNSMPTNFVHPPNKSFFNLSYVNYNTLTAGSDQKNNKNNDSVKRLSQNFDDSQPITTKTDMLNELDKLSCECPDISISVKDPRLKPALPTSSTIPATKSSTVPVVDTKEKEDIVPKGYSPPILPIPTYEKVLHNVISNPKSFQANKSKPCSILKNVIDKKRGHSESIYFKKLQLQKERNAERNRKLEQARKITLDEYKKRLYQSLDEEYQRNT